MVAKKTDIQLPKPPVPNIGMPAPLPQTGSHLNPGLDPVLAAKVLLNDLRLERIQKDIAAGALDWLAWNQNKSVADVIAEADRYPLPTISLNDGDQLDVLILSTIENMLPRWLRSPPLWPGYQEYLPMQARAADKFKNANLEVKRTLIRNTAKSMGLTVTAERGGQHVPGSYHYRGLAIDVAGPTAGMERFFKAFARHATGGGVRELFYDPLGSYDDGQKGPAIGGHGDHVHIAFDPPPG